MLEGTLLDRRYLLGGELGAGVFGVVHRARQRAFGITLREVAVKLFDSDQLRLPTEELLREALTLIGLVDQCPDPAVRDLFVHCYDAGRADRLGYRPYLVMELAQDDLADRIGGRALPVGTALGYARQIARAVAFLHEHRYLHRDLKPGNVLVAAGGRAKVADLGLAVAVDRYLRSAPAAGELTYQPPEALALERCTPAADVYSVGLICYELLTGSLPPGYAEAAASGGVGELVRLKLTLPEPPSERANLELRAHPELEKVVLTALSPYPNARYKDGAALLDALWAAARQEPARSPRPSPQEEIELLVSQARAAQRRGDQAFADALASKAAARNDELPDQQMIAETYRLLVERALHRGEVTAARRIAKAGLRRRRDQTTYGAMALAWRDDPQMAEDFRRQAGVEEVP